MAVPAAVSSEWFGLDLVHAVCCQFFQGGQGIRVFGCGYQILDAVGNVF
jgi:hypothetical protein